MSSSMFPYFSFSIFCLDDASEGFIKAPVSYAVAVSDDIFQDWQKIFQFGLTIV